MPRMGCQDYSVRWHHLLDGDTVDGIAAMYGTSADEITRLNPWLDGPPPADTWMAVQVNTPSGATDGCDLIWHTSEEGDTLESVASAYCTTVECISGMNPWIGSDSLETGARLIVSVASGDPPMKPMPPQPCTRFRVSWHRIMSGDTLFSLAQRFGTTVECLQHLNPWAIPTALPVGCFLVVAVQSPTSSHCREFRLEWHQLRPGDTLFELARRFGTTVECLAFWHPWIDPMNLPIGCWVLVGISEGMSGPVPCKRFRLTWHRIMPGDTLAMLAMKFGTTLECLQHLNSWAMPGNLPVGCCLLVGIQSPTSSHCGSFKVMWHQIRPGDTLCTIASQCGTSVECLICWNPWAKPGKLPEGCWIVCGISEGVVPPPTVKPTCPPPSPPCPPPTLPPPTVLPCTRFMVKWHQLVPGDTFWHLAKTFGTTVECLQRLNSWAIPTNLPVGCWVAISVQSPTSSNCNDFELTWYHIQNGDMIANVAPIFGTTVECLAFWNSWVVPTNPMPCHCWIIGAITETRVPAPMPMPCGFSLTWHQLVAGDTFFKLAGKFNTTVECLQRFNSWADPLNLPVGCWIVVAAASGTMMDCHAFNFRWHQIMHGDTLFALAQRFGTTVECLSTWNSWAVPTNLPVGCWLVVGRRMDP